MREVQESAAKLTQLLQDYGGLGGGEAALSFCIGAWLTFKLLPAAPLLA